TPEATRDGAGHRRRHPWRGAGGLLLGLRCRRRGGGRAHASGRPYVGAAAARLPGPGDGQPVGRPPAPASTRTYGAAQHERDVAVPSYRLPCARFNKSSTSAAVIAPDTRSPLVKNRVGVPLTR